MHIASDDFHAVQRGEFKMTSAGGIRTLSGKEKEEDKGKARENVFRAQAEALAKQKFVRHWDTMDLALRNHEIDKCVTSLHNACLGNEIWFLSNLQMSVKPTHSTWYPIWFVLRRTIINLLFLLGSAKFHFLPEFDWRVFAVFTLAISAAVHFQAKPFRHDADNNLDPWALQLLLLVFTVDMADTGDDGYLSLVFAICCSIVFTAKVGSQIRNRRKVTAKAHSAWQQTQKNWDKLSKLEKLKENHAAVTIQKNFRGFRDRAM